MNPQSHYNARYVCRLATVAALGGLLFGYDFVVIGGAKPFYEKFFQLTSAREIGWANSCALLGCLLGSLVAGAAADRFGRKILLIASAAIFAVSSVLTGWAPTFAFFVVWRIAGGVAIGIASNVSPVYIAEVSPAPWRGRLVSMNQLTIVVGILAAQIVNWLYGRFRQRPRRQSGRAADDRGIARKNPYAHVSPRPTYARGNKESKMR